MNRINKTNRILSKVVAVTLMLILIYCLGIGVSCRKGPGNLKSQRHTSKSGNVGSRKQNASKAKDSSSAKGLPTLPGAEGQTKVDTLTLEILEAMANSWSGYLNDPNNDQLKEKAVPVDKARTENLNSGQHLNSKGR